jgi:hypothetical protein
MRRPLAPVLFVALISLLRADTPAHSLVLLNDKDLAGWEYITPGKEAIATVCHLLPDGVLAVDGKPNGYLQFAGSYENYRLHAEWRWPGKAGNSGVLLHISPGPVDRIWPTCFQMQMKNTRVGDMLPMAAAKFAEPLSPDSKTPQLNRTGTDSEKAAGEWNSCDIVCRGDTIEVTLNGVLQNKVTKCIPASGQVGFQLEGIAYELRNVRLEPLK